MPWAASWQWMHGAMNSCWRTWRASWRAVWRPCSDNLAASGRLQAQQGVPEPDVVDILGHHEAGFAHYGDKVVAAVEAAVAVGQAGEIQRGGIQAVGGGLEVLAVAEHFP